MFQQRVFYAKTLSPSARNAVAGSLQRMTLCQQNLSRHCPSLPQ